MDADPELARAWARAMAAPPSAHLPEEAWERLLDAADRSAERAQAFEHVSECAQCATVYRELVGLRDAARGFDPAGTTSAPRARQGARWAWLGAAAAVLLVALVGLRERGVQPTPVPSPSDTLRSGDGAAPQPQEPRGKLAAPPAGFRWDPAADYGSYHVELVSASGAKVWSSPEVAEGTVAWPGDLKLEPGRYYWRVVARPTPTSPEAESVPSPLVQIDLAATR